jgi:hypothetical protein
VAVIIGSLLALAASPAPWGLYLGLPVVMLGCGLGAAISRGPNAFGIFGPVGLAVLGFSLSYLAPEWAYDLTKGFSEALATFVGYSVLLLLFMLPIGAAVLLGSGTKRRART